MVTLQAVHDATPSKGWDMRGGSADPLQPSDPLSALNKRLCTTAVLTADDGDRALGMMQHVSC